MKHLRILWPVVLSLFFAVSGPAYAEDPPETMTLTVEDVKKEDGEYKVNAEETIEENGITYVLDSVEYIEESPERKIIEGEGLDIFSDEADLPLPEDTVIQDGVTCHFKEYRKEEGIKTGRTAIVTVTVTRNETMEGAAAESFPASGYTDPDTEEEKTLEDGQFLSLTSSKLISESWGNGDYTGQMTVYGYEYTSFDFEGVTIPKNEAVPLGPEYYPLIMRSLGLSEDRFRITSVSWNGDSHQNGDTLSRNALITADVYNVIYEDTYEGTVSIPDIPYTRYIPVYEEAEEDYVGRLSATAVITYKAAERPEEMGTEGIDPQMPFWGRLRAFLKTPAGTAALVGIALLLAGGGVILFILHKGTRRKKKEENT